MRPRLLDLFCGAGGAAMGYHRAGFDVVGVDINPQPNYPFTFRQQDALDFLDECMSWPSRLAFDAIHASPPCQFATSYIRTGNVKESPNLIPATRELLTATGLPYVIENVAEARAELRDPVMLCGSGFGLDVQRHRLFEATFPLMSPGCSHGRWGKDRFPGGRSKQRTGASTGLVRGTVEVGSWDIPLDVQQAAMGIEWMPLPALSQAIPPAYTEHIGGYLMRALEMEAAA
jgi:DNA (cytosine-5)-methyltransferase 1